MAINVKELKAASLSGVFDGTIENASNSDKLGGLTSAEWQSKIDNIQTTSRATFHAPGWYRVAKFTFTSGTGVNGALSNTTFLIIKQVHVSTNCESHILCINSVTNKQTITSISSNTAYTGNDRVFTKARYTVENNTAYLEVYYNLSVTNEALIELLSPRTSYEQRKWEAIEPVATDETVEGVTVTTTYDIPANASPVTDLDLEDYYGLLPPTATIPSGADLNTYLTVGVYSIATASVANSLLNKPSALTHGGKLVVENTQNDTNFYQTIYSSDGVFRRYISGNTFNEWKTLATTSDLTTALEEFGVYKKKATEILYSLDLLNNELSNGIYYVYSATNIPSGSGYGFYEVVKVNNNYKEISWRDSGSNKTYKNCCIDGAWKGWERIATTSDLANYLSLSGPNMPMTTALVFNYNGHNAYFAVTNDGRFVLRDDTANNTIIEAPATGKPTFNGTATGNLPLTGGTVDGYVTIKNDGMVPLTVDNVATDTNVSMIGFANNGSTYGYLGYDSAGEAIVHSSTYSVKKILHAGNYHNYALPLSGGTISDATGAPLKIQNTSSSATSSHILYHGASTSLGYLGFYGENNPVFTLNDASTNYSLLHLGNYKSYVPTLTGVGATGTWGISITGNANASTYLKKQHLTSFDALDAFHDATGVQYAVAQITGLSDATGMKADNAYVISLPYTNNQYGAQILIDDDPNTSIKFRHRSSGTWQSYYTLLSSGNYTSYSPSLTGTGASGTWGIGISGTAATATALTTSAGSATQPVYFSSGKPVATTYKLGASTVSYTGSLSSGGWKSLGGRESGNKIVVAYNNDAANWNSGMYSSSIVFGSNDTKGMLDLSHNTPIVSFAGSSVNGSTDDAPSWYFKIKGTTGKTYTMPSSDGTLVTTSGGTFTGNLTLQGHDTDRFITFEGDTGTGYDWRIGHLGSGSGNTNYFVIQSNGSSGTYTNALKIGMTSLDATFGGTVIASSFTGNLTGNAATATTLSSTLSVDKGGTGATTLTSGYALIGNGTGAVTTRAITNMVSQNFINYNTNLMTTNTLAYWNGAYNSSGGSNLLYCNKGAFGIAATYSATSSITSGSSALITSGAVYTGLAGKSDTSHTHTTLKYSSAVSSDDAIDGFLETNTLKSAIWNSTSTPGTSNGILISGGYTSTSYGFQLAIDDDPTYIMSLRQKGTGGWNSWKRIPMGDGTGASGTWGIGITGNAATATTLSGLTATVGELNYVDGVTSNIQTQLNGKLKGSYASAVTAATAGWYRIATSASGISNCTGIFEIASSLSGHHTTATITAATNYGTNDSSTINVLQCSHYGGKGLTKARIVYHTTYTGNYAYLEVYMPNAGATTLYVHMVGGHGWSLVTPNTAGSIPSGYSNKEVTLSNDTMVAGTFSGNATSATKASGVTDYGNTSSIIQIGYNGAGATVDNLTHIAGYIGGNKIKDVSKDVLKSWLGLGSAAYTASTAYATASHTHNYAGSSSAGGSATSAVKLDTATAGSATQPVYFSGGKPVATTYTLGKSVPSDAKFTDTVYTHPNSGVTAGTYRSVTVNAAGHVTAGSNPTVTVAQGGTGATDAATARTNLGITPANIGAADASHTHSYLPLSGGTITGNVTLTTTKNFILREHSSYTSGIGYDTSGNECIALWAKNSVTRLRWHAGVDMTSMAAGTMMNITPDFEVSKASGTATGYIAGNTIVHSGNIGTYALPKSGGAVSANTNYTTNQVRNTVFTTTDPGAGVSTTHANGSIIAVYE